MVDRDPPTIPHNLNLSPTQLRKLHRYLSHVVGFPITLRQTSNFMDVRQGYEQHWKTYKEEYASGLGRRRIRCFEKDDTQSWSRTCEELIRPIQKSCFGTGEFMRW